MATEDHLEWHAIAHEVRGRLASEAARDRFTSDDALLPRDTMEEAARARLELLRGVEALESWPEPGGSVASDLATVTCVDAAVGRARRGGELALEELANVEDLTAAATRVAARLAHLEPQAVELLPVPAREGIAALRRRLRSLQESCDLPATLARSLERGSELKLADRASPVLGGLRKQVVEARRAVTGEVEHILRRPDVGRALADRYWTEREGRVVLPVRSDAFSRAGSAVSGIIHGSSGSGQTLFVEPHGLVDLSNSHRRAQMAVHEEERRILVRLSRQVGAESERLEHWAEDLCDLDRWRSVLSLCRALDAIEPVLTSAADGVDLALPGARHPLMVLRGTAVVASDLVVKHGGALVVTGPNAGGKTVALKTVGLCVLMAQAGMRLPTAAGATVPLFRHVVTDVGDDQSIAANLSTFSAHIAHVQDALACATSDGLGTLILLDEIAVGTEPEQGAALAEAILVELVDRRATVIVTTHYERLKLLAQRGDGFVNAAVGFDLETLTPTFRVSVGAPGSSSALAVAQRLGLDACVLERARSLLGTETLRLDALLAGLQAEREHLAVALEATSRERVSLETTRARLSAKDAIDEERAAKVRAAVHRAATVELRSLQRDIQDRRKALRLEPEISRDEGGVSDPRARSFAREATEQLRTAGSGTEPQPSAPPPAQVELGDCVGVAEFGAEGTVVAIRGRKVTVQMAGFKTTVARDRLVSPKNRARVPPKASPPSPRRPPSRVSHHFGASPSPVTARFDNVVDVRGCRADETITMVEVFLDRAICDDVEAVIVRHGHGSGALRKAVRDHLQHLRLVRNHRSGLPVEGGDAVTVIWVEG